MATGQGLLAIRGADDAQVLSSPTRVTGSVDEETGVLSGVTMSTPPLEFETVALGFPVDVKATFTQVGPGTGLVAATPPPAPDGQPQRGTVALRVAVTVSLDLKIRDAKSGAVLLEQRCETPTASPVNLELISDGPYTEPAGGKVVDPDFEIPEVPITSTCIREVSQGVNGLLGGSGHSLSLVVQGDLPVPELKPETTTTLTVDPAGGSIRGNAVTLTATVAEVEPNDLDPTGTVVFREGTRALGTAELAPDGTATLTTRDLRAGDRDLTAAYQGDAEFAPSTSAPLAYNIAPAPIITGGIPEFVTRGAPPVEFDVTIDNTGSNRAVPNARLDVVLPGLSTGDVVLERQLPDNSWVNVPLPFVPALLSPAGTVGPAEGVLVPAKAVVTYRLRISTPASMTPRAAHLDLEVVTADGSENPPTVASVSWRFNIVTTARTATTSTVVVYDNGIRPGQTLYVEAWVMAGSGYAYTGEVEFLLDGKVVPVRAAGGGLGPLPPTQTRVTINAGYTYGEIDVPADLAAGPHLVSFRYLGDASYLPSTPRGLPGSEEGDGPFILQVLDPLGPLYTCDYVSIDAAQFGAYVQAFVRLPAYAEDGDEVDLDDVDLTVVPGGIAKTGVFPNLATAPGLGVDHISVDLGAAGNIEGDTLVYEPDDPDFMIDPDLDTDHFLHLHNVAGTVAIDGQPGEVAPLPIEQIVMSGIDTMSGARFNLTCVPHAEPVALGQVGIAGVSLAAEPTTTPARVGDEVLLTATVAPAAPFGLVEFFSGSISLGTASGASGTATLSVDDLPVGANFVSARYTGVAGSPFRSNVVQLDVLPAVECAAFAESGHAATVRLVYIELLDRCPDQAGFDFWTGRLVAGTSPEVFARSIARTPEAVGQVVDDAYRTMLGRVPDEAGRAFWVNRMRAGSGRYDQLLADLGASAEFWNLSGGTRAGFVTRVYQQLLNRAPDEAGLDYWVARLTPGASRRTLILSLANLDEPLGRLVGLSYDEILGRAPSGTERSDGIGVLRRTGDRSGFYAQLIGRPEFSTRAQGFPNPED